MTRSSFWDDFFFDLGCFPTHNKSALVFKLYIKVLSQYFAKKINLTGFFSGDFIDFLICSVCLYIQYNTFLVDNQSQSCGEKKGSSLPPSCLRW